MSTNDPPSQNAPAGQLPSHAVKTPPESPTHPAPEGPPTVLPISPPATVPGSSPQRASHSLPYSLRRLYSRILRRYHGKSSSSTWEVFFISPEEYQALWNELEKDTVLAGWIKDKLRYDYDSLDRRFVLRMPLPVHDVIAHRLQLAIERELDNLKQEEELRPVIEQIEALSTSNIRYDSMLSSMDKKSPDGQFSFDDLSYPTLIIEVANAQKSRELPHLVESYMERSKGQTKTVITIDCEYRNPRQRAQRRLPPPSVVYSIYRERVVRDERTGDLHREAFEETENQPISEDGSVNLFLSDFCPEGTVSATNDRTIAISHAELEGMLAKGEKHQRIRDGPAPPSPTIPFVCKRKRSPTPTLRPEDEDAYGAAEAAASACASAADSSFSSADVTDVVADRTKRVKTRSQKTQSDVGDID